MLDAQQFLSGIVKPLPAARSTLLRRVLVPQADGGYRRCDVLISGGKLAKIAEADATTPTLTAGATADIVDCSERMLMPGFFNGHAHSLEHWLRGLVKPLPLELWVLALVRHAPVGEEGWYGPESFDKTPSHAYAMSALHCGVETLLSGCTAIMDHLFVRTADDVGAAAAAYKALGLRAFIAPMLSDDEQLYHNYIPLCHDAEARNRACGGCGCGGLGPGGTLRTEKGTADPAKTKAALDLWEETVNRYHRPDEGICISIGPVTAYSASEELLRGAAQLRQKYGLTGHTHLLETRAQALLARQVLPSGSAVKHLRDTGFLGMPGTSCAHSCWLTDEEARIMAECGATVVHCPLSNLRLGSGVLPLRKYASHDVTVALGCDGSASSDGQDMLEVVKLATMLQTLTTPHYSEWPTPREMALLLAARNGYRGVNMGGEAGEIAEGQAADVSLWDLTSLSMLPRTDPVGLLVYGSRTQAPGAGSALDAVWVRGIKVVDKGAPVGVDLAQLRQRMATLQPGYRDPVVTDPSSDATCKAAEVEYRAALCIDRPSERAAGSGAVSPQLAEYEAYRALYNANLPVTNQPG